MSTAEVHELMARAEELPYGEAKTVLVEDALRRAEATGDDRLAFRVRMSLTTAYQYGGEPAKAFTTFSRCLAEHDRDPGRHDAERRLLWHFKWIVHSLTLFAEVPLDRTYAVMDDMERRYRAGGYSLQAVYHYRNAVARHVGDLDAADEWYAKWHAAPRDELSDCEGCDPTGMVRHLEVRGRDEEALAVAAPVLGDELTCSEQPHGILTALLPVYLRTGRLDEARDAHRRAYRLVRSSVADLSLVGEHIWFCAVTGNEPRGFEILQRHLGWLDRAPSPCDAMEFAAAGALLLRRMEEAGAGDVAVRRPGGAGEVSAAELRAELAGRAREIAARFDARNGTSYQGEKVERMLADEPVVEHLPLTAHDRRRPAPAPSPARPAPEPEQGRDLSGVTDLDALLDAADEARSADDLDGALAAWRRFDEVAGDRRLTVLQTARRADGRGVELLTGGEYGAALAEWRRAVELFAEAGDRVREQSGLSRIGALLFATGEPEEGIALMRAAVAVLDEHDAGAPRAFDARMRLADALLRGERPEEGLAVLDGLAPSRPGDLGEVELYRGRGLGDLGRDAEATAVLRRACTAFREAGRPDRLAEAAFLLGRMLAYGEAQDPDAALEAYDEAVANAAAGPPGLTPAAHAERGSLLLACDRAADAVADMVEAVAGFTALGHRPQAAYARLDLAAAYLSTGRPFEAAEVAEEAMPVLAELDDPGAERRCRFILAHAQRELGEEQAAEVFTSLAEDEDDPVAAAQLLETAADVLTGLDKDALAADGFLRAAEAFAKAGDPFGEVRCRRRGALCRAWGGGGDRALAEMQDARRALGELPAQEHGAEAAWEAAALDYDEARMLATLGRLADAVEPASRAVDGFAAVGADDAAQAAAALRDDIRGRL
ncbi:hypothetical protein Acsp04_24140 [Actinomadura sp. NBRC 104425]|uniref:hypothetical protein n=1 Tax=Actinomadura sp. NBRC 104425 TaxID=3032204 RepID=UPI0024A3D492|nr:hypothetical protein [Actinomadura sp. NBRC 104425]GLZ12179.1 hypothetical protein Acsp04_24140 [Actinomadura sp. NBRC 104425]